MITFDSDAVIDPGSFKEVLAAGGVHAATIGKADKGLVVVLRIAKKDRILGQRRWPALLFIAGRCRVGTCAAWHFTVGNRRSGLGASHLGKSKT